MKRWTARTAVVVIAGAMLTTGVARAAEDGAGAYQKNCVSCHGAGGKGDGPAAKMLKPPPGDFATGLKGMADADIAKLIKEGGKSMGKNHPAFGTKLSDDQINAVVQHIKGLK